MFMSTLELVEVPALLVVILGSTLQQILRPQFQPTVLWQKLDKQQM
jgi:hypothetical protein